MCIQSTKKCTKCLCEKELFEFYKDKNDGLTTQCKDCKKEYLKIYRVENRDKILLQLKNYYNNNIESFSIYKKIYSYNNAEKIKQWQESNKEILAFKRKEYRKTDEYKAKHKNQKYIRRSKERIGDVTANNLILLEQNAKVCYWCNTSLKNKIIHIDHYIPLSKGGEHTLGNLVVSCAKCNQSKSAKDPIVFANSIGRLL